MMFLGFQRKEEKHLKKDFIITRELMKDNSLTKSDCFLFGNIYNLSRLNGYCFATNKVLSNLSFVKIRTINYSLKRLKEKGYINDERVKNDDLIQRRIYVNNMHDDSGQYAVLCIYYMNRYAYIINKLKDN